MKNMKKLFCLVLAAAMLLSVMAGCGAKTETSTAASETTESASSETASTESGETAATDGEITIAFIGNTTGDYAQYGIPVRNAVMMYFDQLNAAGGINGKKVVVKEYDDKGDGVEAVNAYNLAKENGITAVVGSVLTGATIALADATYEDNMPQITASATATGVTVMEDTGEVRTNVFRACFIDPFQGQKMADYAVEKLGAKTAAIFYETGSDYSEGLKNAFVVEAERMGLEIVDSEAFADRRQGLQGTDDQHCFQEPRRCLLLRFTTVRLVWLSTAARAGRLHLHLPRRRWLRLCQRLCFRRRA